MTTNKLSRRQVYWEEFLSRFNFDIFYILAKKNKKIDSFIYWPNDWLVYDPDDWQ